MSETYSAIDIMKMAGIEPDLVAGRNAGEQFALHSA